MKRQSCCAIIYCDYGNQKTKKPIRLSYSQISAANSWKKFHKNFSKNGWRCWQEDTEGNIINDSKK